MALTPEEQRELEELELQELEAQEAASKGAEEGPKPFEPGSWMAAAKKGAEAYQDAPQMGKAMLANQAMGGLAGLLGRGASALGRGAQVAGRVLTGPSKSAGQYVTSLESEAAKVPGTQSLLEAYLKAGKGLERAGMAEKLKAASPEIEKLMKDATLDAQASELRGTMGKGLAAGAAGALGLTGLSRLLK